MALKKNDFIEIEFSAKVKETGEIFDSNIKENIEKIGAKIEAKPFIFPLGQGMFLKGVEEELLNIKESKYPIKLKIELAPEKAFGKRNPQLMQKIPLKLFKQQNLNPIPGSTFNFDGRLGKIIAISGGRVIVDFNNPVAGKEVIYEVKILRKIDDLNERIRAINEFLFKRNLDFVVKDKKIIINTEKGMKNFVELFKDKFKEIFGLELEVKEIEKKEEGMQKPNEKHK